MSKEKLESAGLGVMRTTLNWLAILWGSELCAQVWMIWRS